MTDGSFCKKVKDSLSEIEPKKGCCKKTYKLTDEALSGFSDFSQTAAVADKLLCDECAAVYLRYLFIRFGTVTDPNKSYHLELSFPDEALRNKVSDVIKSTGLQPKSGMRRDRFILYFKSSEAISDFLAKIGALDAVFEILNLKLMKEATISINRQNNFEAANIQKTVNANINYINSINFLIESGNFDSLPDDLRETGKLRIENDTASLAELGRLHSPSISKSGVKHRLDRLSEISEKIKNRNIK